MTDPVSLAQQPEESCAVTAPFQEVKRIVFYLSFPTPISKILTIASFRTGSRDQDERKREYRSELLLQSSDAFFLLSMVIPFIT